MKENLSLTCLKDSRIHNGLRHEDMKSCTFSYKLTSFEIDIIIKIMNKFELALGSKIITFVTFSQLFSKAILENFIQKFSTCFKI